MPISRVKPVLIDNIVMRRRSAWEPIIRHDIMLAPYTRSLKNGSTVHSPHRVRRRNPVEAQFSGPEWRDLLHAGRARYVYGFAALNVGLEAMAKTARRQTGEDEGRQNRAGLLLRTPAQTDRAEHGNSCAGSGAL